MTQDVAIDQAKVDKSLIQVLVLVLHKMEMVQRDTTYGAINKNRNKLPFIKLSINSPIGRKLDKYIEKEKIIIESSITSDNFQMAASLVNNGIGYTILDEYTAKACKSENTVLTQLNNKLDFNISLMFLKNVPFSIPTNSFIEFLTEFKYEF